MDASIQIVICSAYSDHSWEDITRQLKNSDNLLILKKPFEIIEIIQLACALTKKWELVANLQNLVQKRTAELENSSEDLKSVLEATTDGILSVDLNQNLINYNHNFIEIWNFPKRLQETMDIQKLIAFAASQVQNPDAFLSGIEKLMGNPERESYDEFILKDRRVIARFTNPKYLNNTVVGLVIIFRDITDEKRLQERLSLQYEMSRIIYETNHIEESFLNILEKICKTFDWDIGNFWQVNSKENTLHFVLSWYLPSAVLNKFNTHNKSLVFSPGQGWLGKIWQTGKASSNKYS